MKASLSEGCGETGGWSWGLVFSHLCECMSVCRWSHTKRRVLIGPSQGRTHTSPLLRWCRVRSDAFNCLDSSTLSLFLDRFVFCAETQASEDGDLSEEEFRPRRCPLARDFELFSAIAPASWRILRHVRPLGPKPHVHEPPRAQWAACLTGYLSP